MVARRTLVFTIFALTLVSLALAGCGSGSAKSNGPAPSASPVQGVSPTQAPVGGNGSTQGGQTTYNTAFPLPDNVQNFTGTGGEAQVNFQTSLSLKDVVAFYRQALTKKGLTERTGNTAITDTTFSLVFDGWGNGQALIVQGVDLGKSRNVNIRFEKI